MSELRVIAIPTEVASAVRAAGKDPQYGFPTHTTLATGYGPCRHCLRVFRIGAENRTLFTYDPFGDQNVVPLPGPIYIHSGSCDRYAEQAGYPEELRQFPALLMAYGAGRALVAEVGVDDGTQPQALERLFDMAAVEYVHVRDKNAGCFDFRVERQRAEFDTSGAAV